jgi:hypothetical protein
MKMEKTEGNPAPIPSSTEASKLVSLLALATGALAMPQTSHADIIFTDLSSAPVTVGPLADPSYLLNLPGTHQFSFRTGVLQGTGVTTFHVVVAGQVGGGFNPYVQLKTNGNSFALPVGKSVLWSQINMPGLYKTGFVGTSSSLGVHKPNAYDHQYLAFQFKDSSHGNAVVYGWVELSEHFPASGGPEVTIFGYAYDNTGAPVATGIVPEPASGSLLAFGAMTLGAAGVRNWRRRRAQA